MKFKNVIFLLFTLLFVLTSCRKRLDGFLFNNNKLEAYGLDFYDGELALNLPSSYYVPDEDIHLFSFTTPDNGQKLKTYAIYIGDLDKIATDTVILYCHGNRDHMDHYWPRQKLLSYIGGYGRYGVLMFDYPGYGMSEGEPTEENMYAATNEALKWLKEKGLKNNRLIIYGYSLGTAAASKSVGDKPFVMQPSKVVLEAPFASSEVMVQDAALLGMPASFFVDLKIDNAEQMKKCNAPLYWLHGVDDDFIAMETHGKIVYQNHTKSWKKKSEVAGAGHNDLPTKMGLNEYKESLLSFIVKE